MRHARELDRPKDRLFSVPSKAKKTFTHIGSGVPSAGKSLEIQESSNGRINSLYEGQKSTSQSSFGRLRATFSSCSYRVGPPTFDFSNLVRTIFGWLTAKIANDIYWPSGTKVERREIKFVP